MVIVFPYGTCAVCESGLAPRGTHRPSRPRVICDSPDCAREASRYGARRMNALMARRRAEAPPKTSHVCPQCNRDLPFDDDHFYVDRRHPDGSIAKLSRWCKECKRAYQSVGRDVAAETGRRREQHRKLMALAAADPELMKRIRAKRAEAGRAYRKRHPEKVREQRRRYYEKLKRDPERLRRHQENRRIAERLRKERQGLPMNQRHRSEGERDDRKQGVVIPSVPAKPLGDALERRMALLMPEFQSRDAIAEMWGTADRQIRAWRDGERQSVQFDVADALLVATGLLPFDVWDDPDVLRHW